MNKNKNIKDISDMIEKLEFKKKIFGVDETDVLKKIRDINELYKELFLEQELKYKALEDSVNKKKE